jgi:hypothetical protein
MGLGGPWEPFFAQATSTEAIPPDAECTAKDAVSDNNRRRMAFLLGLFLIFLQCFIQVGNAVLTQFMFEQMDVQSPILMTYVGMSMLLVSLPLELWNDYRRRRRQQAAAQHEQDNASYDSLAEDIHRISTAPSFRSYHCFMDIASRRANDLVQDHSREWNHRKHIMAACLLTPAMFLSDWLFNSSLRYCTLGTLGLT